MEFQGYFEPSIFFKKFGSSNKRGSILENIFFSTPERPIIDLAGFDAVLIGITEKRNSICKDDANLPDLIRKKLYTFSSPGSNKKIADLGNFINGNSLEDTYFGLRYVLAFLLKKNIIPVLMGGSNHIAFAAYLAYESIKKNISITAISSRIDLLQSEDDLHESYLNKILNFKGDHLFNYSILGFQTCFVSKQELELLDKLYFDSYRLGSVRNNLRDIEPVMRDTDFLAFDLSSIKQSDAPGSSNPSPNGFYSEEACQISRYAGISDKLTSFGIFEICTEKDINEQTINLSAQIIWYFLEGLNYRIKEYPLNNPGSFTKYIVTLEGKGEDLVFYKSQESNRWWLEIPSTLYNSKVIIASSYDDYQKASNQELPDRWWRTFQKIN